jgi:molybdenum cofactor biosynthesis enzyme MoaA
MPFNGAQRATPLKWNEKAILHKISEVYTLSPCGTKQHGETATYYQAPSMIGRVGIIPAYSRSFCGTCNRLRVTPQGLLRTCLYSDRGLQLRDLMRSGASNEIIKEQIVSAVTKKEINGFVAESNRLTAVSESMAQIGG